MLKTLAIVAFLGINADAAPVFDYGGSNNITVQTEQPESVTDAFGRQIVVQPREEAALIFSYGLLPRMATTTYVGSGSSTTSNGVFQLNSGAATNSSASMRSRRAARYTPGIAQSAIFSARFSPCVAGSTQTIGVQSSDGQDGWAIGCNGDRFGFFRSAGGTTVFTATGSWSSGEARFDMDITKLNVYRIDYQWLGAGVQHVYFEGSDGKWKLGHQVLYAGQYTATSVRNPSLHLRAYVANKENNTNLSIYTASMGVFAHGMTENGEQHTSSGTASFAVTTTEAPVLTVCSTTTFSGQTSRASIIPAVLSAANDSGTRTVILGLYLDAILTGAVLQQRADFATSFSMFDVAATSFSGGSRIAGFPMSVNDARTWDLKQLIHEELHPGECLTVTAKASAGTANLALSLHVDERP